MKHTLFRNTNDIYRNNSNFTTIRNTCDSINVLNSVLIKCLPESYVPLCRFGSIDEKNNIAVLFIKEQQIMHIIRTMSDHILRALANNNFYFNGILFKLKQEKLKRPERSLTYKALSKTKQEKLLQLAKIINKPEIVLVD